MAASNPPAGQSHSRQKRVLPTRLRRGGPGIGSCDVDMMILETRKRQSEDKPLIPPDTEFLLTTNTALVSSPTQQGTGAQLNTLANQRYFDRPEVLRGYREQLEIETPEFVLLSVESTVGGRFRPRGVEDKEATDTSDTVYEKRHRKYETFEKRLRLREKEKLKHEQYKLKERIEQLRVMDPSAFLAMPSTHFSSAPDPGAEEEGLPVDTHPNGPPAHNEGERRRQEMLDVALSLEERYRALLPHDKKGGSERGRERPSASVEPLDVDEEASDDDEEAEAVAAQLSRQERGKLKLKIRFSRQGGPPADRPRNRKANSPSPSPPPTPRRSRVAGTPTSPTLLKLPGQKWRAATLKARSSRRISSPHRGSTASSDSDPDTADVNGHDHRPRSKHPYKYKKREIPDDSPSHSEREPIPTGPARPVVDSTGHTNCVLLAAALRASAAPKARHTQRNILAFGAVVPEQITAFRNFKLPWWIKDDDEAEPEGE